MSIMFDMVDICDMVSVASNENANAIKFDFVSITFSRLCFHNL